MPGCIAEVEAYSDERTDNQQQFAPRYFTVARMRQIVLDHLASRYLAGEFSPSEIPHKVRVRLAEAGIDRVIHILETDNDRLRSLGVEDPMKIKWAIHQHLSELEEEFRAD